MQTQPGSEPPEPSPRLSLQVIADALLLLFAQGCKPPCCCIVVMGPGVDDAVGDMIMRQIGVIGAAVKSKLQNPHPRETATVSQPLNFRSYDAEVLSNQGEFTNPVL